MAATHRLCNPYVGRAKGEFRDWTRRHLIFYFFKGIRQSFLTYLFKCNQKWTVFLILIVDYRGGRKGLRWCGFGLFLVRFCGNFHFNLRYCGFTTLSGLRLLQTFSCGIRWKKKKVFGWNDAVRFSLGSFASDCFAWRSSQVFLFYSASAYKLTLWLVIARIFYLKLDVITLFIQWYVDLVTFWARCRLRFIVDLCYLPSLLS